MVTDTETDPGLPAPLVPPEVDLRGYKFMPFYGEFMRTSDFNARVSDAEYRAAVNLWWSSWQQVPAASVPDDDSTLCRLADLGRDTKAWKRVKRGALSGFVLCSDGRWYHEFLAVEARKAFEFRQTNSTRGKAGAAAKWAKRHAQTNPQASGSNGASNAPITKNDSRNDGNRQRQDITPYPLGQNGPGKSTPQAAAHSLSKAEQQIKEQATWSEPTPVPEHLRTFLPKQFNQNPEEPPPNPPEPDIPY